MTEGNKNSPDTKSTDAVRDDGRLRSTVLAAYGAPAMPLAALTLPLLVFLPSFYAGSMELGLALAGTLIFVARLWDMVTDPLIGWLSDRTDTRLGRRRPWIIAGTPLAMAGTWFLFVPPDPVPEGFGAALELLAPLIPGSDSIPVTAWAAGGWLVTFSFIAYLGWSMMIMPLSALGAEISDDYDERSRITAWREGMVVAGILIALGVAALVGGASLGEEARGLKAIATVVVLALPIAVWKMATYVPERPPSALPDDVAKSSGLAGITVMLRNAPFRRLLIAYFINALGNGFPATLFVTYVATVLAAPEQTGTLLLLYFACGVAAVPLWIRLSFRFGKHRVWCAAMLLALVVFATVPLLGPGDAWLFYIITIITGLTLGADLTLPASMQADVIDQDRLDTGRERAGQYFGAWGLATKLALAVAAGAAFTGVDMAGLELARPGQEDIPQNSNDALFALACLYALVPAGLKLVAIAIMWSHPLDRDAQKLIQDRLLKRK